MLVSQRDRITPNDSTPKVDKSYSGVAILRRARLAQIRSVSRGITFLQKLPTTCAVIRAIRSWSIARAVLHFLLGYRRVFNSLAEAREVASSYLEASHESAANINRQIGHGGSARPSDYPVLFYLRHLVPGGLNLFDLGGNVGNLYYCYSKYLSFPHEFDWCVHDKQSTIELGRVLARKGGESRLRFTNDLKAINGAGILLVSGALHYFELPLPELLRELDEKPRHVFVNRTPMTTVKSVFTVQDAVDSLYACKTIHRQELVDGMSELNYEMVDGWSVPELSLHIPCYPEYSVSEYSGIYFRLNTAKREVDKTS
jgi:putative methyltransferase (TIGR04325 family)